jgi:hypothetical protein
MIKIIPSTEKNSVVKLKKHEYGEFLDESDRYVITQCEKQLPKEFVSTSTGGYFIRKNLVARVIKK